AFSADSKTLASGGYDGVIRLWDAGSGMQSGRIAAHTVGITELRFTISDKALLSIAWSEVAWWDLPSGTEKQRRGGDRTLSDVVAVSSDGQRIASRSSERPGDNTIRLRDAAGKELFQ